MIDFLKIDIVDHSAIRYFENCSRLDWVKEEERRNHRELDVINTKKVMEYESVFFVFYESRLNILIKPHYLFNRWRGDGMHNANRFTINDCTRVLREFANRFEVDFNPFRIVNIEFGINAVAPIDVRDLITWTKYHGRNEFAKVTGFKYAKETSGQGKENEKGKRYEKYKVVKFYAKGIQYPDEVDSNTFRFEIKSNRSRYIREHTGVETWSDLFRLSSYERMRQAIQYEFEQVLILDHGLSRSALNGAEIIQLEKYLNVDTSWYHYLQQYRNAFGKNKKRYDQLVSKAGGGLHRVVANLITKELENIFEGCNFRTLSQTTTDPQRGAISVVYKGGICTHERRCVVTGLSISMQRGDSYLLSHKGIKYYLENEPKKFHALRAQFLSDRWQYEDIQIQVREIAHNIRNQVSNQRIKGRRLYPDAQTNLLSYIDTNTN